MLCTLKNCPDSIPNCLFIGWLFMFHSLLTCRRSELHQTACQFRQGQHFRPCPEEDRYVRRPGRLPTRDRWTCVIRCQVTLHVGPSDGVVRPNLQGRRTKATAIVRRRINTARETGHAKGGHGQVGGGWQCCSTCQTCGLIVEVEAS